MIVSQPVMQFTIELKNQVLQIDNDRFPVLRDRISYIIADNEGKSLRKGSFSGKCVQMRLNGLRPGYYEINLFYDNSLIKSHPILIN